MALSVDRPNSQSTPNPKPVPNFLMGGGEMGQLIRDTDWSKTPLGPSENWPQSLKTAVSIMLDNKFGMYIAWGKQFTQLYNDSYRPILGSTKHPAAMGNTTDKTFAESWHIIGPLFENVMRGNAVGSEDWMLPLDRHGYLEDCYFTFSYSPIRDESGEVGGVLVTVTETTERVRNAKASQEAKARAENAKIELQGLFAQAPVGIALTEGPDHVFALANSVYLSLLFGKDRKLLGRSVKEAIPEVKEQGFIELLDGVYRTGEPFVGKEVPLRLRQMDGSEKDFYVTFIYQPARNAKGDITGILCVVYDVTEQVDTRIKVTQSEERYKTLAESLPQMMWTAGPDGSVNYANERCLRFTGMTSQEKYGEGWVQSIHPDDIESVGKAWMESMQSGATFNSEYRIRRADGDYRWFVGRAVPVKSPNGSVQYWIGTATDIEDQKQAIEKLQTEQQLREQFVATLTHDLRSPLTAAKMSAQLISRSSNAPDRIPSLTGRIIDSIHRADQMIENLLDANRIKAGEPLRLQKTELELHSFVRDLVTEMTTVFGDRFIIPAEDAMIQGHWSQEAFRRIIENLCSNAVKYGSDRTPITIRLSALGDETAEISIHNLGNPIPTKDFKNLFEPYTRATTPNQGIKGWGLGLTVVKGLVEAHGGTLRVTSTADEGTTFTVRVPKKHTSP